MNEEQKEETSTPSERGDDTQTLNPVERAESIVKRLEEAERRIDEKTRVLQELEVKRVLGGKSEGAKEPPKEETPQEYAKRMMSGQL